MLFVRLSFTKCDDRGVSLFMPSLAYRLLFLLGLAVFLLADVCAVWLEANTKLREEIPPARLLPVFHFTANRWAKLSILLKQN